jgi:phosphoribosyl 1,2-cyclic phosphodiesterase
MTLRFASIGSGSQGNATLVEKNTTRLLIDCGFSITQVQQRLERLGRRAADLTAILITHEHGDHVRGVSMLARKFDLPVWMTPGTAAQIDTRGILRLQLFNCHEPFSVNDIEVHPYPVPHDAREPCQYVFTDGASRFGVLTDTGCATRHIENSLSGCHALMLECNHDIDMLAHGSYPHALKERIGGRYGHLSNDQTMNLLSSINCAGVQHVVAAHLSEKNNTPDLARQALSEALGCAPAWIGVADQETGLAWREIL